MSAGDALLTFVSVFVAALLAFYLDGLRERRATRHWVGEYLGFWRQLLVRLEEERQGSDAGFVRIDDALGAWLDAEETGAEPDWPSVDAASVNVSFSFTPQLLGAAVSEVPADLLRRMFSADVSVPMLTGHAEITMRLFEAELRHLVLARTLVLEPAQRRAVELYRTELRRLHAMLDDYLDLVGGIRSELEAHHY